MAHKLNPLTHNVPIVDAKTGNPTPEFMRKWAQQKNLDATIPTVSGTGILVQTGTNTWAVRLIVGGTGITVTNGSGVSGNPSVALANTAVTPGTYGDTSHVAQFTVDQQGRLTNAAAVAIASGAAILPLVNGDLPGPSPITDDLGQYIGVPL